MAMQEDSQHVIMAAIQEVSSVQRTRDLLHSLTCTLPSPSPSPPHFSLPHFSLLPLTSPFSPSLLPSHSPSPFSPSLQLISTQSPRLIQGEAYKELEEQHKHTLLQLREAQTQREQLLQTNHDLTAQLRGVQEEGEELGVELERVKEELAVAKSSAG